MIRLGVVGVGVSIVVAAGVAAPGSAAAVRRGCALPRGSHLVAQDSAARIVYTDQPEPGVTLSLRQWRYCWRRSRGYHSLVTGGSFDGGAGNIVNVSHLVLSGPWAAWTTVTIPYGGRYGYPDQGAVSVRYLGGKTTKTLVVSPYTAFRFDQLVLTPGGVGAWEVESGPSSGPPGASWAIQALNGSTGRGATLDSTPTSQGKADPFSELQLYTCQAGCSPASKSFAFWQNNGTSQSAPTP